MVHSSQGRKEKNKKLWQNLVVPLEVSSSITEELGPPNSGVNHALKIHAEDKACNPEDKANPEDKGEDVHFLREKCLSKWWVFPPFHTRKNGHF